MNFAQVSRSKDGGLSRRLALVTLARLMQIFCFISIVSCGDGSGPEETTAADLHPAAGNEKESEVGGVELWKKQMTDFGLKLCDEKKIKEQGLWEGGVWYYDGIRTYYQIESYTGDSRFAKCARLVKEVYGDYVTSNQGKVPGWRVFAQGLAADFRKTGDENSRTAVLNLAKNSAFSASGGGRDPSLSRETAYIISSYLTAQQLGAPQSPHLVEAVSFAKQHVHDWITTAPYVKPFMVALTAEALITYAAVSGDRSAVAELPALARWLRENAWDNASQSFQYIVCRDPRASEECGPETAVPAPDLNLLIVPLFGYVAQQTQDFDLAKFGDQVFESGVTKAYLAGGKQFNQNYRWSFDYLRWRSQLK